MPVHLRPGVLGSLSRFGQSQPIGPLAGHSRVRFPRVTAAEFPWNGLILQMFKMVQTETRFGPSLNTRGLPPGRFSKQF